MPYRQTPATQAARARRRAALLDAARGIVASEGFGAASVRAVTAAAGVSPGTLYGYFGTLDELLVQVFRRAAAIELAAVREAVARVPAHSQVPGAQVSGAQVPGAQVSGTAQAQLVALVDTFAGRAIRGRRLAWALLAEPVGPLIDAERLVFRRAYADTLAAIVADGVDSGELPAQDPLVSGPALVGAIGEALIGPLTPLGAPARTAQEVVTSVRLLCLRAVGASLPTPIHEPAHELGELP